MKYKPKSAKSAILMVAGILALLAILHFSGIGAARSAARIGYVGNEGWSRWSGSYTLLDGTMKKAIHPSGDVLTAAVQTDSGTISIAVTDASGAVIFDKDDIETGTYKVAVSGKVEVRITANQHKGSFDISG